MKKNASVFLLSFACVAISLAVLISNWNSPQKWRFNLSLAGFIIFAILFLAGLYATFFHKKRR